MTYVVTEHCVKCKYTDCAEVCPVEAFHEAADILYINPNTCIDCNLCVASCPVEAIYRDEDVPERYKKWIEINATECEKYPTISEKKEPLTTAINLAQWKERDAKGQGPP